LINAIYFKGNWANKFNANRTEKQPFYIAEGSEKQVEKKRSFYLIGIQIILLFSV
jgi:serine protease inhibitor